MEWLRDQLPVTMWNLSIAGYGPRQKISALMAYALPKRPKWLVVEFYAGNDTSDAIQSDVCKGAHTILCEWSIPERRHRLVRHPIYSRLIDQPGDIETFKYYTAQNFTLATTRYLIETLKEIIKRGLIAAPARDVPRSEADSEGFHPLKPRFPVATGAGIGMRPGKGLEFVTVGMALTHHNYERLVATLAKMEHPPTVILLYNPSPYELYRDILRDRDPEFDQVTEYQLEAQRLFAQQHGWSFLDLTVPLRQELQVSRAWIFGRYDLSHWSLRGTAMVAPVLRAALLAVIGQ